ncbi:hypothetical protein DCC62_25210 [candidate division KSB1 bacterium]|nr:MAG: hypothetical protein DCC62_25210 [candidate division KSB1 bacterium]
MRAQFSYSPIVSAPLEKVWALYPDANSINKISPPFARVNFARLDLPLRAGAEIILADKYPPPKKNRWHAKIEAFAGRYFAYRHRRTMILL